MKKTLCLLLLTAALFGCSSAHHPGKVGRIAGSVATDDSGVPVFPVNNGRPSQTVRAPVMPAASVNNVSNYRLAESHWSDVAKIRNEATRLSYRVSLGDITKVQAAQYLNNFRTSLVGRNAVDDNMYEIYLRSAVDSQRGAINTEQSKLFIQNALRGWQQRWPNMRNKPANPAFTNFLMEVMGMKPLQ